MWRCFFRRLLYSFDSKIFSTYVEVFPRRKKPSQNILNFLHVCGGVSYYPIALRKLFEFSPRMWRCFHYWRNTWRSTLIFSTYVEVFPLLKKHLKKHTYFLHVCGGVSHGDSVTGYAFGFSPRMWRCFLWRHYAIINVGIFSTYVEVFLTLTAIPVPFSNFLHVCGGVSARRQDFATNSWFSPRMWRCFLGRIWCSRWYIIFSTYVEVFPYDVFLQRLRIHFLHVCGGVSIPRSAFDRSHWFSPRMWRCFHSLIASRNSSAIFSTYVEVFPCLSAHFSFSLHFLHVCGGVSTLVDNLHGEHEFSPRMWRCF